MKRVKTQHGFTLIEIMIAIGIFSLIGLASTQVLFSVLRSDELSQKSVAEITRMQRTFQIMQRDIMQITARKTRINGGEPQDTFLLAGEGMIESDDDGIAFTRLGWRNPAQMFPRGTVQAVGYRLQENKLQRLHYLYPDQETGTEPQVTTLLESVENLKFEYFDNKKWQKNWQGSKLPRGIAVILTTEKHGEIRWQFMVAGGQ